jgi:hypothetical protein
MNIDVRRAESDRHHVAAQCCSGYFNRHEAAVLLVAGRVAALFFAVLFAEGNHPDHAKRMWPTSSARQA